MGKKTTLWFRYEGDIWPIVEKWAVVNDYKQIESTGNERTYQKGAGFLVAPMMLKVRSENQEATLTAWIRVNLFARIMALFIVPSEMGIESGGFRLVVPRRIARNAINQLLGLLGQKSIS